MMSKRKRVEAFTRWLADRALGDPVVSVAWTAKWIPAGCNANGDIRMGISAYWPTVKGVPHIDVAGGWPTTVVMRSIAREYAHHMQDMSCVVFVNDDDAKMMDKVADEYACAIMQCYMEAIKATKRWRRHR